MIQPGENVMMAGLVWGGWGSDTTRLASATELTATEQKVKEVFTSHSLTYTLFKILQEMNSAGQTG
jgi:hypothetical protein